jgi:hypothetical protein
MTTDHDFDPDTTVRMPRPAPKKEDLEDVDPDSTLIREDWGSTTIVPPNATPSATPGAIPSVTPGEAQPPAVPPLQEWERTLRRPAYTPDRE